jgi:hypothetical protein
MRNANLLRALALGAALALAFVPRPARAAGDDRGDGGDGDHGDHGDHGDDDGRKYLSLGIRAGQWIGILRGDVRYPVTFSSGSLGASGLLDTHVRDADVMPYGELFATSRWVSLYADIWYGHWVDHTTAGGSFTFQGVSFSGSEPVRTQLDALSAQGRIQLNIVPTDVVEVGLSLGARYVNATGKIEGTDPTTGVTVRASRGLEAPIPQVGASVTFFAGRHVDIYARARGFVVTYNDWDVTSVEGEAGAALNLGDHLSIGAEYRAFYLQVEDTRRDRDTSRLDVIARLQGPMVYLRLRF